MNTQEFEQRKRDHIQHSLDASNQAIGQHGLDAIHLIHEALPDLDFSDVSLNTECFGEKTKTPFYISGMTAGHVQAPQINHLLAEACETHGWAFGVGSQRRDLNDIHGTEWKEFRQRFSKLILIGNLGISQLIRTSNAAIQRVTDHLGANALAIHTNPLQEVLQPEGTPQFRGNLETLERICKTLNIPCILKETGTGFSARTLKRLSHLPLAAIDVSGLGGTHWGRIEGARASPSSPHALAAQTFANWGESTVNSVLAAKQALSPKMQIWASGGVRSGLDAAKLLALGAHRVGYAKPALEVALKGEEHLHRWMEQQEFELKIALFCTGYGDLSSFKKSEAWERQNSLPPKAIKSNGTT